MWVAKKADRQTDTDCQMGTISSTTIQCWVMAWLVIDLFLKVLEALDRLATFEMAFGIEQFRCVFRFNSNNNNTFLEHLNYKSIFKSA